MADREHSYGRLLIIHQGALGDFLLALPVFEGLHRLYPEALLDFCSRYDLAALLANKPYFGNAYSADSSVPSSLYHEGLWRNAQLAPYFNSARAILFFGQDSSRIIAARLSQLVSCPVYWIQSFPSSELIRPVSRFLLDQLHRLGLEVEYVTPQLTPLAIEKKAARKWITDQGWNQRPAPIMVHTGSGGRRKIWPLSRWWSLLDWLRRACDHPILMILGQADSHLKTFALEAERKLDVNVLEHITLQRLVALASESHLYMGNDSGVSHLAGAVGIPTVVIFGPTLPEIWAPQGAKVCIVRSHWQEPQDLLWSPDHATQPVEENVRVVIEGLLNQFSTQNRAFAFARFPNDWDFGVEPK